jgi:hypothetical protein
METFKKRQKEMKRLERQRDKAAKRKEIKERKALGLPTEPDPDGDIEITDDGAELGPAAESSTID